MMNLAKTIVKALLPAAMQARIREQLAMPARLDRLEKQVALLAAHQARHTYGSAAGEPLSHSVLNDHELQIYSQNGEDGILQFIYAQICVTNRTFAEFGMGDGRECNTAYLSLHYGWRGLLMDGNAGRVAAADALPAVTPAQAYYPCDDAVLGLITPERFAEVAHLQWEEV